MSRLVYAERLDPMGELLTWAVRGGRGPAAHRLLAGAWRRLGDAAVQEAARANKVQALVGDALASALGDALPAHWRTLLDENERRVRDLVAALRGVVDRLRDAGCRSALVESAGVLLGGSRLPLRAFGSGDLDLLVDELHWDAACAAFEAEGFAHADRRGRPTRRAEYRRELEGGREQWLEVGFAPFDRMWLPLPYHDRCAVWLERRVPARRPDGDGLWVLKPEDALAFVAFHTSLHSFVRSPGLRLHVDVDRVARAHDLDWDAVLYELRASGIETRAFVSLSMARGLLGTPIPDEVLAALDPGAPRREALFRLLRSASVFADGRPKLPRAQTVLLDVALDDRGPLRWAAGALAPDEAWLREHFDREGTHDGPGWQLHLARARALATRWRPR